MDVLIVGLGEVGSHLAKVLSREGKSVTVLDSDSHRLRRVSDALDVHAIHGDGSRPDSLDLAGAATADLLLAVSNDDRVNMLTCLFGKRMGAKRTVLRVKDLGSVRRNRTFFKKNVQYDLVLSLEDLAAEETVKTLRQHQAVGVENFADGRIQLRRLRLSAESPLIGTPVKELKMPVDVLIVAIDRNHEILIPGGDDELRVGDEVFALGEL